MSPYNWVGALALGCCFFWLGDTALAQAAPGGAAPSASAPNVNANDMSTDPEQAEQRRLYRENVYNRAHPGSGDKKADATAHAKQESTDLVKAAQLACDVTDAAQVAEGPATVDGKAVDTKTYETICGNGMGYFLISQPPASPSGFSCFAADAARAADIAQGKPSGSIICSLPQNADVKAMATAVLSHAGISCQVRDLHWMGQSAKAHLEYTEVACMDGTGYVLTTAQPGSPAQPVATTCKDAATRGIMCKLTNSGAPSLTLQTFKDAIAQRNLVCDASAIRVVGQETIRKRHVVEFQCPQYPKGLIALIPLAGNTEPFETYDCAGAAKHGIICKLTTTK
ncbi:MAG: hypothetical protein P4L57_09865 [Rhizomicrobium sp.]|nr:hypothetical protein [Rhizomicrobium sp.]